MKKAREWLLALAGGLYSSGRESCGYLRRLGLLALLLAGSVGVARAGLYGLVAGTMSAPAINDTMTADAAIANQSIGSNRRFCAESTGVFNAGRWRRLMLHIRVIPAATDTTDIARLAIAVKCFPANGDSIRSCPDSLATIITPQHVQSAATGPDSTASAYSTSKPPVGSGTGVWPGEFVEDFDPWNGRGTDGSTSAKSNKFHSINGRAIPLAARLGVQDFGGCGYMQIRVRLLDYKAGSETVKPRIQLWVTGQE